MVNEQRMRLTDGAISGITGCEVEVDVEVEGPWQGPNREMVAREGEEEE